MILLDMNIVSEVTETRPAEAVVAWLNGQDSGKLYVSAIIIGEIAYGESAARIYGELMGDRKELGLPMTVPDGQIAAIARLNHLAVATRNVLEFERCGIDVLNPFEAAG
jgi:hypothetical protein